MSAVGEEPLHEKESWMRLLSFFLQKAIKEERFLAHLLSEIVEINKRKLRTPSFDDRLKGT